MTKRRKRKAHHPISRVKGELTSDEARKLKSLLSWAQRQGLRFPISRTQCEEAERPCPWVRCRHHAYLEVMWDGSIKLNWPGLEVWEIPETCTLDAGARAEHTLEEAGAVLNITRERVRQLEARAMANLLSRGRPRFLMRQLVD